MGIKDTLFNLAFRSDVVNLVEVGINSLRVTHFNFLDNDVGIQANLDCLEETREEASLKAATRQRQVAQYYNKKVKTK